MLINQDQLHSLLAVIDLESFGAAAKRLRVSPPAVSQQMKALADAVGVKLFERVGRRAVATPEARALADRVREPMAALERAIAGAVAEDRAVSGDVRIGGPLPFSRMWLRPRLLTLLEQQPGIVPTLSFGVPSLLAEKLRAAELDFVILAGPVDAQDLVVKPIHTETFVAVASRAYLKARPAPDRYVVFDADHAMLAPWWRAHRTRRPFDGHVAARVASLDEMLAFAEAGLGVAVLPDYFVAQALAEKRVVNVDPSKAQPKNLLSLAWRARAAETARFVAVREALTA